MLTEVAEAKEPSFLRKLREENGGGGSLRHERPLARPRKQRAGDEDDDQPTYVDEESRDTISRAEYESLLGRQTRSDNAAIRSKLDGTEVVQPSIAGEVEDDGDEKTVRIKQQVAVIGAQKRKKVAKVIGDDTQDHKDTGNKIVSTESRADKKPNKRKKVKLSFDEDADG